LADHDNFALMRFGRPHRKGVGWQVCTQWDQGWWICRVCGLRLPPEKAGILLDAALMCSAPGCASAGDGMHADVRRAFRGGRRAQPKPTTELSGYSDPQDFPSLDVFEPAMELASCIDLRRSTWSIEALAGSTDTTTEEPTNGQP
jgi:hypothetical protein